MIMHGMKAFRPRKWHMKNEFTSFEPYVGAEIKIISGLSMGAQPDGARIIADFPHGILIEAWYTYSDWTTGRTEPRFVRHMIAKNSLACGDVQIEIAGSREKLYGNSIASWIDHEDAFLPE